MKKNVIKALKEIKGQIEEGWVIPTNDRGSGSAGVHFLNDTEVIDNYLHFAVTGDNDVIPQCNNIEYLAVDDFSQTENQILDEIMQYAASVNIERDEVLGFVICYEHYDMDYKFYITHIKE